MQGLLNPVNARSQFSHLYFEASRLIGVHLPSLYRTYARISNDNRQQIHRAERIAGTAAVLD
jgi:hypothetical protein